MLVLDDWIPLLGRAQSGRYVELVLFQNRGCGTRVRRVGGRVP